MNRLVGVKYTKSDIIKVTVLLEYFGDFSHVHALWPLPSTQIMHYLVLTATTNTIQTDNVIHILTNTQEHVACTHMVQTLTARTTRTHTHTRALLTKQLRLEQQLISVSQWHLSFMMDCRPLLVLWLTQHLMYTCWSHELHVTGTMTSLKKSKCLICVVIQV